MPVSKLTAEQRAQKHVLQAMSIRVAGKVKDIKKWLAERPDLVNEVHTQFKQLMGQSSVEAVAVVSQPSEASGSSTRTPTKRPPLAIADAQADSPQGAAADSLSDAGAAPSPTTDDTIASHNYNFGEVSVANLSFLLETIDDRVFNKFNIKAVLQRGKRNHNQKVLLELLTFCTGVSSSDSLQVKTWADLGRRLKGMYELLGSRGHQLRLPPDWAAQGFYELAVSADGGLDLRHRYRSEDALVTITQVVPEGCDVAAVTVVENYSEEGAYLCFGSAAVAAGLPVRCSHLLAPVPKVGVASSAPSQALASRPRGRSAASGTGKHAVARSRSPLASGRSVASQPSRASGVGAGTSSAGGREALSSSGASDLDFVPPPPGAIEAGEEGSS